MYLPLRGQLVGGGGGGGLGGGEDDGSHPGGGGDEEVPARGLPQNDQHQLRIQARGGCICIRGIEPRSVADPIDLYSYRILTTT